MHELNLIMKELNILKFDKNDSFTKQVDNLYKIIENKIVDLQMKKHDRVVKFRGILENLVKKLFEEFSIYEYTIKESK